MMKQAHFLSLEEIKASVTRELKRLKKRGFYQVLPWVAGSNAKVYQLGGGVL